MRRPIAPLLALALLSGCGKDSGPVKAHVFGLNPATNKYEYYDAELQHLDDATQMRGQVVAFQGGSTVVVDALAAVSDPKSGQSFRAEGGSAPKCSFTESGGVLVADDFDSLAMASSFSALERARTMFERLGVKSEELNTIKAYYDPNFQALTKLFPTFWYLTDNAAYAPTFDGFLIVPHLIIQDIPFYANLGVMTHEYGHKVHNRLVEGGAHVPHWTQNDWAKPAANQIRGVDEGLSDVFGGLITGDSNFIAPSISSQPGLNIDRDMAKVRVMATKDVTPELSTDPNAADPDPHEMGAFVAAAIWQLGTDLGDRERVTAAVLGAERALGADIAAAGSAKYDYSVLRFWRFYAQQFTGGDRDKLCGLLKERFSVLINAESADHKGEIASVCPGIAAP